MVTTVGVLISFFLKMAVAVGPGGVIGSNEFRLPCTICCRKFSSDALERHEKICEKMAQKKRKTFDSAKQRILGTDIPTVHSAPPSLQSGPAANRRSNKNLAKHKANPRLHIGVNNNRETPVQVRGGGGGGGGGGGPPTSFMNRLNSGLVQCPSCERNFSEKAADRHITWCKELRARIPRSPPCTVAKYRLDARIQYKAPMPGKRRNSPPRSPTKMCFPADANVCPNVKSPISPVVMGTAIQAKQRRGNINNKNNAAAAKSSNASSNQGSQSNLSSNNGHSDGMIHCSSWEYFDDHKIGGSQRPYVAKQLGRPKLGSILSGTDVNYDPYESAQRQMEELLLSSTPSSPTIGIKSKPSNSKKRDHPQEVHSNNSSAWSLESDKDLEDIEEDIAVFDDPIFEEIIALQAATPSPLSGHQQRSSSRHPRKAVSREEALFGSKNNTAGSLDSDYGSLLRRSPSTPVRLVIDPSSLIIGSGGNSRSSSETSLPRLNLIDGSDAIKMSRFCHECGTKYPVNGAKFCCECGIRRLCV